MAGRGVVVCYACHMDAAQVVGGALVAGLVVFLVGAAGWRIAYEQELEASLRTIASDRRRRAWIHLWMLPAMFITPAGLGGVVLLVEEPVARVLAVMAAVVYGLGAVCWTVSLLFRLTVVPWAADAVVADGAVPVSFRPLDAWASSLYVAHMSSAYVASVLLGGAVLADGLVAAWVGWAGLAWGVLFLIGFVATRFAGPFNPPFWAHLYTGVLGVALLL